MKRGSGKEETFLDVPTLRGRTLEIRRQFLRNELPLASIGYSILNPCYNSIALFLSALSKRC